MRASSLRVVAILVVAGLVVPAALAAFVAITSDGRNEPAFQDADALAGSACRRFDALITLVEQNGPAAEATRQLDEMVDASRRAAAIDPIWVQLASGMQTLRLAFNKDDPAAVSTALPLVRQNCALTD